MLKWEKAICPVCHKQYEYPENTYKPQTCGKHDCIYKFHFYPERYKHAVTQHTEDRQEQEI